MRLVHLTTLIILLSSVPAFAQPSLIERVLRSKDSIVTIQAQKIEVNPNAQASAALTPDGQIVVAQQTQAVLQEQTGAGIIIDPAGFIVTNTHTILYAQFIFVTLSNGLRLPAEIAVIAPESDFTILKVAPPSPLRAMPWADSDRIKLGDTVISIGNSPFLKETISEGRVKGIGQNVSDPGGMVELIETDLNLYKGDSGGPILDREGNFLGIVFAKNIRVEHSSLIIPSNKIRMQFLTFLNQGGQ